MSPIRLSPSVLHILTEYLSPLGCREPWLHYSSPPRAAMVRPTSPLLPARRPFAKVPELGSWALTGGHWARDRGRPKDPRGSRAARTQCNLPRWNAAVYSLPDSAPGRADQTRL